MKGAVNRHVVVFSVALVWLVLDQLTKTAVTAGIAVGHGFSVIDGCFNIVHVLNRGALGGEDGEGEGAPHHRDRRQQAGDGHFTDRDLFHRAFLHHMGKFRSSTGCTGPACYQKKRRTRR